MYRAASFRHLAMALLFAAPAAAQTILAECQAMITAGEKQFSVPSHAYMTNTGLGPTPMHSEMISINGAAYLLMQGHWMKSPVDPAQLMQQAKQALMTAKSYGCTQLPDEAVGGVATAVYSSHTDMGTGTTDSKVWVAKATGLPVKSETEMTRGEKKSHVSVRYSTATSRRRRE